MDIKRGKVLKRFTLDFALDMASLLVRAILTIAVVGLLFGQDAAFWLRRGSRRPRPRPRPQPRCPDPTAVLPGAQTTWDDTFTFLCPDFQVIRRIRSAYCNTARDRVWRFDCESIPGVSVFHELFWSGWVNDYGGVMNYQCPFNAIITGFKSQHNDGREDRRWNVRCSKVYDMVTFNNVLSNVTNEIGLPGDYNVSDGFYLRGMHSYHDNDYGDRRYRYDTCLISLP